jgi:hypothetical protein
MSKSTHLTPHFAVMAFRNKIILWLHGSEASADDAFGQQLQVV